jgi:hypothetical protein
MQQQMCLAALKTTLHRDETTILKQKVGHMDHFSLKIGRLA